MALTFHRVTDKQILDFEDITTESFIFLLNEIHDFCSSLEQIKISQPNKISWLLTFDDGFSSDFEIVLPLLKKFKIKGLFFITTSFVGKPNYMTWDQIRNLSESGMNIGSHSINHQDMLGLSRSERINELETSKNILEEHISKNIEAFSFPFGRCNKQLINEVFQTGYKYCFTSKPGSFNTHNRIFPRIALNSSMSKNEIQNIVKRDKTKYLINIIMYHIRDLAKYCLGIEKYWRVREFIHSRKI